jgi:riboflavin synthase
VVRGGHFTETVSRTAQDQWREGRALNLEQALKLGDELGGHIVTGHVDGVGRVAARNPGGRLDPLRHSRRARPCALYRGKRLDHGRWRFADGERRGRRGRWFVPFGLSIIPHTAEVTTIGNLAEGDSVNLEIDVLARYLKRMQALKG